MKRIPFEKVLALSPHTDDIEFGCGGTLARLIDQGADVHAVVFSLCEESVPDEYPDDVLFGEMQAAAEVMGIPEASRTVFRYPVRRFPEHRQEILEELVTLKETFDPDVVFTPATIDIHQDHEVITQECIRAFRYRSIFGYELPWNNISFQADALISLTKEQLAIKSEAISCYKSQRFRHYSQPEFFQAQASVRGVQHKKELAEAFEVIRLMM